MKNKFSLALAASLVITTHIANADTTVEKESFTPKAVVIIFNPPQGMEKDFFETFSKEQSKNLRKYLGKSNEAGNSINLIPAKVGDPLIHITIIKDAQKYAEVYKKFGPKELRGKYVNEHSQKYGDLGIPKIYLRNTQSYFAELLD